MMSSGKSPTARLETTKSQIRPTISESRRGTPGDTPGDTPGALGDSLGDTRVDTGWTPWGTHRETPTGYPQETPQEVFGGHLR
jgi:hypothetical protein